MSDEFSSTTTEEETPEVVLDLTDEATDEESVGEDGEFDEVEDADPAWARPGKWYVVHTQAG